MVLSKTDQYRENRENSSDYSLENKMKEDPAISRNIWLRKASRVAALYTFMTMGVVAGVVSCDDNSDGKDNNGEQGIESKYTDLNQYYDNLKNMFGGTFKGVIENGYSRNDTMLCEYDGKPFEIKLNTSSSMRCQDSEQDSEKEVNCKKANIGYLNVTGTFRVANDMSIPLKGNAYITTERGMMIDLFLDLDYESQYPRESFECYEEWMVLEDEISGFKWSKRHSEEYEEDVIWEICNCNIEDHVQK